MVVDNNDDQPIRFDSVYAYQLQHFLIANLQHGKSYSILTGNIGAVAPVYDLSYFKDSIRLSSDEIIPHDLQPNPNLQTEKKVKRNTTAMLWIWIPIGIVLLALIWLSFRLIRDISNKQQ